MTDTTHLGITLVEQSQAQKEVTVNEALPRIDAVLNTGAISQATNTPPVTPDTGDLYIVGSSPTDEWAGKAKQIAYYDQAWRFITPNEGMSLWINDEDVFYHYNGTDWVVAASGGGGGGTITLSGDISGSGSSSISTSIGAGKVTNSMLAGSIDLSSKVTSTLPVTHGGTGNASLNAYGVLCGGTTSNGAVQALAGLGSSGQVLTSNGTGVLPSFQSLPGGLSLPSGLMFNFQQMAKTDAAATTSTSYADTGLSVSITPTSASHTVLVRAVMQVSTTNTAIANFRLLRGATAIALGDAAGSRTRSSASAYTAINSQLISIVIEWVDSPSTTSETTYKVQWASNNSGVGVYLNRSADDGNSAPYARTASSITAIEISA
jgi:hypothetical protein